MREKKLVTFGTTASLLPRKMIAKELGTFVATAPMLTRGGGTFVASVACTHRWRALDVFVSPCASGVMARLDFFGEFHSMPAQALGQFVRQLHMPVMDAGLLLALEIKGAFDWEDGWDSTDAAKAKFFSVLGVHCGV